MKQKVESYSEYGEEEIIEIDIPLWVIVREKIVTLCLRLRKRLCYLLSNIKDIEPW